MTHIPNVYLLIQVKELDYQESVLNKIPAEILVNFKERVLFVQRSKSAPDKLKYMKWCSTVFNIGTKEKKEWEGKKYIKMDNDEGPNYKSQCVKILEYFMALCSDEKKKERADQLESTDFARIEAEVRDSERQKGLGRRLESLRAKGPKSGPNQTWSKVVAAAK